MSISNAQPLVGVFATVAIGLLAASAPYYSTVEAFAPTNNFPSICWPTSITTTTATVGIAALYYNRQQQQHTALLLKANDVDVDTTEEWTSLTEDGGVKMRILSSSPSQDNEKVPIAGKNDVTVEYTGTLALRDWSIDDVIACWLPDQGLSTNLAPKLFTAFEIDGKKLLNTKKFNKKFIFQGLGVTKESKIQNLLSATTSLREYDISHPPGTVFDKNRFSFRLGKGMAIPAFELALKEMKMGDTVVLMARADYAYGNKGSRSMGKYAVPPYATVSFDLTLVDIQ